MFFAGPVSVKSQRLVFVCLWMEFLVGCGGSLRPSIPSCDPNAAPEVLSLTIQNTGQETLQNYPVAILLDETVFDFTVPKKESAMALWDATTRQPMSAWLESYDAAAGKALLWVKVPGLGPQASQSLLLTAGHATGCVASTSSFDGYSVFPFFSDVHDTAGWHATNHLRVTNTITAGPLTIGGRSVIESDGLYNGFPGVAQAANGDFVLAYKKGTTHVNSPFVVLRHSLDKGMTWSPEVVYFDSSQPDPALLRTPLGALVMALGKADQSGREFAAYSRSTDNGLTWAPFTFFFDPSADTFSVAPSLTVGQTMYGAGYGLYTLGSGQAPGLWSSSDDGFNWTKLSVLREAGDPSLSETAIARTAPSKLFAIMRADDTLNTYGRYSSDMGMSWGPLISYTSQVGVLQGPVMVQAGSALILMGREAIQIPGVQPPNTTGFPRQLAAFVSYDGGQTFGYGTVLDAYTGKQIDGGYSWPMLLPNGHVYVAYYSDSHNQQKPDIKALTLSIGPPSTVPAGSIHVLSQLAPGVASHALNFDFTRYALEFRFRSSPTPGGSQFSVLLQGQASGSPSRLVNWELPSTHAADPTSQSGIFSNQQFVPILSSFNHGQDYRLRTVVDEIQGTQQASVLDSFGELISTTTPQPLAQGTSAHATTIQIGNNSSLRATDTLLDFVFVRPAAQIEPLVTVTRVR
ncbi:MAG: DUF2341 domain-containing protein [Acidobacteriia bacterium]|nr:DUF2341 domain-containing protein [Terriglobia bacterium]